MQAARQQLEPLLEQPVDQWLASIKHKADAEAGPIATVNGSNKKASKKASA